MAYTDIINTTGALVCEYPELVVYLGATDGSAPADPKDVFTDVVCLSVVQSAGGARLDFAELVYKLTESQENRAQPSSFARMVEVYFPDAGETRIHLGDYVTETFSVDKNTETLQGQSQVRPYHYGIPLNGYPVWCPIEADNRDINEHVIFNPTIDEKTVFNRSDKLFDSTPGSGFSSYLWTHPEIADSSVGETYQGQTRNEWTLRQAVHAICELLNPDEDFLKRPLSVDLDLLNDAPPLRNVKIELGTRLHQALDKLLIPLGYNHFIDYTEVTPWIEFFKIGAGTAKELKFAAVGTSINLNNSNTNRLQVSSSIGDSFNIVRAIGEYEEAEVTIPLYAGWPPAADSIAPSDLAKDGTSYPTNQSAWRLWIANEAGDIDPAVSRVGQYPVVPDFGTVFTVATAHRRTLGEPLTYLKDGSASSERRQRMPHKVEYSIDAGATWLPEEGEWTIKLCPDQIGILFDGKDIPQELYDAGNDGRVRITGTLFGDYRIQNIAVKQAWAVNARDVEQVMLVPEKFQRRYRQTTGTYASILTGDADEKNDYTDLTAYSEKMRDQNHYAEVDCEFRLPGWHTEYKIGDLITKVAGREINLDAAPNTAPAHRYVQIVERRFEMNESGGPSTVLIVDRGTA